MRTQVCAGLAFICLFWFGALALRATDRYAVPPGTASATSGVPYNAWTNAATNIQWAVDEAADGETVWVTNGTYCLTNQITVTDRITVKSVNGYSNTLVYADWPTWTTRCFYVTSTGVVYGFSISNGHFWSTEGTNGGGGVYLSNAVVQNCYFVKNYCSNVNTYGGAGGGGVFNHSGSASLISNCVFFANQSYRDGAIYASGKGAGVSAYYGLPVLNCNFISNDSGYYGGGLYSDQSGSVVSNCRFTFNTALFGAGLHLQNAGTITDCTISNNHAYVSAAGVNLFYATIRNSVIIDNIGDSGCGGVYLSNGSQASNCVIAGNYHQGISTLSWGSPPLIIACRIYNNNNNVADGGGGAKLFGALLKNCLIYNNTNSYSGSYGGGIYMSNAAPDRANSGVINCTIVSNRSVNEGGGIAASGTNNYVVNCVVADNGSSSGNYPNVFHWANVDVNKSNYYYNCVVSTDAYIVAENQGNITNDPVFAGTANWRLQANSPCINTGTNQSWMANAVDFDGYARIQSSYVDMGAYERWRGDMLVSPSAVTNVAFGSYSLSVPVTISSTNNYALYWSAVITSSWISAGATSGYISAGSSQALIFTNNSAGLTGSNSGEVWIVVTNTNPNYGPATGSVSMVLNITRFSVTPTNLSNSVYTGHNATNQSFRVASAGQGSYTYHVTTNGSVSWLVVSNGAGTMTNSATNEVLLTYVSSNLSGGVRTGVLAVATSDGGGRTQEVAVTLNVIGFSVSPTNLANSVLYGFNATSQTFGVNAGGGEMTFSASSDAGWLSVSPSSGYSSGGVSNILTNIYLTTNLAAGDYSAQVTVTSADGGGNAGVVGVSLSVLTRPVLNASPLVITQVVDKGSNPTGEYFDVWNGSASPVVGMEYHVSTITDAYSIIQGYSPSEGVSTGEHDTVGIYFQNVSGFTSGVYTAIVSVAATNYGAGYGGYWSGTTNIAVVLVIAGPDAPGQISASKGDYEERVAINWSPVLSPLGGSVTYSLLRHNTFDANYAQAIVSGLTVTNYNDTTVPPGVKYYYWVKCVNSYGQSGTNSAYDYGYRRLSAPAGLFASDGEYTNKVVTSWAAVDGAGSYYVYRVDGGSEGIVYHASGTEFEDEMVSEGIEYTYYVQATNSICGSVMSTGETGYVLSRPTALSASDGQYVGMIALSWNAVHGATAYEIWRSTETLLPPYGGGAQIAVRSATAYNDTSVTAGTKYYYWLKSRSATAVSGFSSREEGYAATASIDLSLWGLVVQPRRIGLGRYPAVVSFRLMNNGGSALSGDNGTVRLTFYSSANSVWGDGDDVEVGTVDERLELGVGSRGIFRVAGGNIFLSGAEGSYYLFMRLAPVWPSTLAPASAGGWVTQRSGALEVSSEGSINYQAMNDYDGDGVSDMVVHGSGLWDGQTADGNEFARNYAFGGSGTAVMGDYDGDCKTDPVVYDESRGYWQALLSGSGYAYVTGWFGGPGYRGVPGDYDGDRKTEAAVYDIYNSSWYALKVGGGIVMWGVQFGGGYEPVIGDYDGDGVWDLAVYNEAAGAWYIRTVSGTLILSGGRWGGPGFSPVPGDYDGDGLWDFAVYENAAGYWYIVNIHGEMIANGVLWGADGYRPVGGDFDGDGLYDLAVYNMSAGKWFIRTVSGTWIALDASWGGAGRTAVGEVE